MSKVRQWSALTALAVLVVLAAGYFVLVSPKRSQAGELRDQAGTQQQANATLRVQLAQLKAQAAHLTEQQARLSVIAGEIPDNPALPALIRTLSDDAASTNVDLVSIAPGAPALAKMATPVAPQAPATASSTGSAASSTGSTASATAAPANIGTLAFIPVTVGITGGYADITQFIGGLEDLSRSFLVSGLTVTPGAANASAAAGVGNPLTVSITGRVFMAANRPAPSVAVPTAPAGSSTTSAS